MVRAVLVTRSAAARIFLSSPMGPGGDVGGATGSCCCDPEGGGHDVGDGFGFDLGLTPAAGVVELIGGVQVHMGDLMREGNHGMRPGPPGRVDDLLRAEVRERFRAAAVSLPHCPPQAVRVAGE